MEELNEGPPRRPTTDTAGTFVVTAGCPCDRNDRVVTVMQLTPTLPRSGGPVTLRPEALTERDGYRVEVPPRMARRSRSNVPNDPPSTAKRSRNRGRAPRMRPRWETIDHRRQCDYSASTTTRVTTLTRESTDGHRDWDVVVGRTLGRIHGSQGGWQDSCGPTPMRENAAGDR